MNYLINEKIIEQIADLNYFCLFDFAIQRLSVHPFVLGEFL
jgi:hypothetical protein